jgi:hypothetical protein
VRLVVEREGNVLSGFVPMDRPRRVALAEDISVGSDRDECAPQRSVSIFIVHDLDALDPGVRGAEQPVDITREVGICEHRRLGCP